MKSRFHKLLLSLLIAVMCANCALPALASAEMSETEKKYFEDSVAASKKTFLKLYSDLWKEQRLDTKLAEAVDRGIDEKMDSMLPGTRSARMMMESNQKEALEMVIKEFAPHYKQFVQALQKCFTDDNNDEVCVFYENLADEAMAKIKDPQVKTQVRDSTKENLKGDGKALQSKIAKSIRLKHKGTYIKPDTIEIDISAPDFNFQVNTANDEKKGAEKTATGTGLLAASIASPIAVMATAAFSGIAALGSLWGAPDKLKASLKDTLSESLKTQQPAFYWKTMESDVRAIFEETYAVFRFNLKGVSD